MLRRDDSRGGAACFLLLFFQAGKRLTNRRDIGVFFGVLHQQIVQALLQRLDTPVVFGLRRFDILRFDDTQTRSLALYLLPHRGELFLGDLQIEFGASGLLLRLSQAVVVTTRFTGKKTEIPLLEQLAVVFRLGQAPLVFLDLLFEELPSRILFLALFTQTALHEDGQQ